MHWNCMYPNPYMIQQGRPNRPGRPGMGQALQFKNDTNTTLLVMAFSAQNIPLGCRVVAPNKGAKLPADMASGKTIVRIYNPSTNQLCSLTATSLNVNATQVTACK